MDLLPEDVLADVLRRLPPRGLAVSRSVCREWRAIVDARCDLRADLLPTTLGGIFVGIMEPCEHPDFLVRPSMEHRIAGGKGGLEYCKGFKYRGEPCILDCYNGLLLLEEDDQDLVVNPATRQCARFPRFPVATPGSGYYSRFLMFDPTLSPPPHYYEVLAIQDPFLLREKLPSSEERSEWLPSVYMMGIYSSRTMRWEERPFAREGGGSATTNVGPRNWHSAYLNRALYIYWSDFIMRITFSNDKYKIINLPASTNEMSRDDTVYLGKSKNRIHFALVDHCQLGLQVWLLDESGGETEWILKHAANLMQISYHFRAKPEHETDRPWILQYRKPYYDENSKEPWPAVDNGLDWNSDEDNALDIDDGMGRHGESSVHPYVEVFGFHPYKEILFLYLSDSRVVAYYFNTSKIQDLLECCIGDREHTIDQAFIYTPCWNGELFAEN